MKPDLDTRLNAQELARQLVENRVSVIDVREAMEFAGGHIEGSVNVPLARLSRTELPQGALVLVCHSGRRSAQALAQLVRQGHTTPLADLDGGILSWQHHGLPLRRLNNAPLPLMRQVQIAAGSLVLLGLGLGSWVAPAWILLSWFVGAGLVFAGISGFCGMARLVALLPWNRVSIR